jgi:hypothetical protein
MDDWVRNAEITDDMPISKALRDLIRDLNLALSPPEAKMRAGISQLEKSVYDLERRLVALERR